LTKKQKQILKSFAADKTILASLKWTCMR
jgi:hypothetical protein